MSSSLMQLRRFSASWLSALVRWLLLCTIAGVMFFSLKGVGETLTPWSQATVSLLANLYYPERGRDQVTVLLFREQDLTSLAPRNPQTGEKGKLPFPVPYATHVETLNALANRSPRAVLIDFSFIDARAGDDVDELLGAICGLAEQGIPVYLATFHYWQAQHGLRKDLFVDGEDRPRNDCFTVVPVSYGQESNGLVQSYALMQGGGKNVPRPSAALSLYANGQTLSPASYSEKMDLIWGALPPRPQRSDTPCLPVSLFESVLRLAKDGPRALERDCPYSNTLSVYSLWNESSEDVDALVRDRFILYGGAFLGTDDWLRSPVHGTIPGVYLHAMALDNLLVYGDDYKRLAEHAFNREHVAVLAADGAIIGLGVAWYLLIGRFKRLRAERLGLQYTKVTRLQLGLNFAGLVTPYLALSLLAGGGLWLAASPGYAIGLGVVVLLLLAFAGLAIVTEGRKVMPAPIGKIGMVIGEKLIDYGWVALMALVCGMVFHIWNFGPRNFWAFAAFLGFTQLIDKRLIVLAGEIKARRIRKMHRTSPWLLAGGLGILPVAVAALATYVFGVSSSSIGLLAVLLTGLGVGALAGVILVLPWIYRNELNQGLSMTGET